MTQDPSEDVDCGAEIEAYLEDHDNPILERALARIRGLEAGIGHAWEEIQRHRDRYDRLRNILFPDSVPVGDDVLVGAVEKLVHSDADGAGQVAPLRSDTDGLEHNIAACRQKAREMFDDSEEAPIKDDRRKTIAWAVRGSWKGDDYRASAPYLTTAYIKLFRMVAYAD